MLDKLFVYVLQLMLILACIFIPWLVLIFCYFIIKGLDEDARKIERDRNWYSNRYLDAQRFIKEETGIDWA